MTEPKVDFSALGFVRVAALSPKVTIGDPEANARAILDSANRAADDGASIVVLPELSITGYSAEDLFFSDSLQAAAVSALQALRAHNRAAMLVVGTPWRLADGRLLNCAAVIAAGAENTKAHLSCTITYHYLG